MSSEPPAGDDAPDASGARSPPLADLRGRLAAKDREIIRAIRDRMAIVREVARIKGERRIAPFDREREGLHIDDLAKEGEKEGLSPSLTRDVFGTLFSASRRLQRDRLLEDRDAFTIGVVGGTLGMGAFLAGVFERGGYAVETMGLDRGAPAEEVAARHDLVIVAVPIAATLETIARIGPHVRRGACLSDVTSLKTDPVKAMLAAAPEGVDVVGAHPMFGPSGEDLDRQKVVLCGARGATWLPRVRRLYELFGAECIDATPEEHDAQMAFIQVLVHEKTMVLGSVLERLGPDLSRSLQFASPIYKTELAMVGRMFSQGADLYADILTQNADSARLSHVFEQEAAFFARAVAMKDRDTVVRRFRQVAAFMTDFAAWARRQSDGILADLVRHG